MKMALIVLFIFFGSFSHSYVETRNILLFCGYGNPPKEGKVTLEFDTRRWRWQCDDLNPLGQRSFAWVHPSPVVLEFDGVTFQMDKDKGDRLYNKGELSPGYNKVDVSCMKMMSEYDSMGVRSLAYANWTNTHGVSYRFAIKSLAPEKEGTLSLEFLSYTSPELEGTGYVDIGPDYCSIKIKK